jgi:hypothetical protein
VRVQENRGGLAPLEPLRGFQLKAIPTSTNPFEAGSH